MEMSSMEMSSQRRVLMIDSDQAHVRVVKQVLAGNKADLVAIANGPEALDYLHRRGAYTQAPRPDLILLELNLPDQNGHDILSILKADEHLCRIPIVVLTASADPADVRRSYTLQGNCYVVKAMDLDHLAATIRQIESFWLGIVTLPLE